MFLRSWLVLQVLAIVFFSGIAIQAGVVTREETRSDKRVLVLENDHVRMAVLPDPGGTVIEFVDKKTGTDFVAGGDKVLAGRLGFGWKDYYAQEDPKAMGKYIFTLPYVAKFTQGPGYHGIHVTCEAEGQRFEREMRLAEDSAELTTLIRITNISDQPRRLQVRWHTYSTLDDKLAENGCILVPGANHQARKSFIGTGYDNQYITQDPYWMAVNYKDGSGMWMTFNKEHSGMQITWTDYNFKRPGPHRGMYVAEPNPAAVLAQPGESVVYDSTFYPFTVSDTAKTMPMGMLKDSALQARARVFLSETLPNLAVIGPYTMTPGAPPAGIGELNIPGAANRFSFSHRRRDRFAIRSWGILDAMMDVPGVQDVKIRTRYYARIFDSVSVPVKISFHLKVLDASDNIVREHTKPYTLTAGEGNEVDVQDDIDLTGMLDGTYRFILEGFVEGEQEPIHTYLQTRTLVGMAKTVADAQLKAFEEGPLVVRPFVQALYEKAWTTPTPSNAVIPIGVEDGSGVSRVNWPVRCGVPLAQGIAKTDTQFELIAPDGKAIPVSTAVSATWMDGSIKWLQVSFNADVQASSHVFYTLQTSKTAPAGKDLLAYEGKDGPAIHGLDFKMGPGRLFGFLRAEDMWWTDNHGQTFLFQLKGEDAGVIIEQNGPDRAVLKATGWYLNDKGKHVAMGELRLEAFRGQRFVKLFHTVTFTGDPWRQELASYGLKLTLPQGAFGKATAQIDTTPITGNKLSIFQRNPDGVLVDIDGKSNKGIRSNGAIVLQGSERSLGIAHLNFWQMAPKQIDFDAKAGTLTYSYWPSASGDMSYLPREDGWIPNSSDSAAIAIGAGRTHEFVIELDGKTAVGEYDKVYNEPVLAIVPPKYLAQTQAMMHLSPFDPQRYPKLEKVAANIMHFYISQQEQFGWYGQWTYGAIPNWFTAGMNYWKDFGRYAWILNEQDIVETPWLCYMRTGDRAYYKFAVANTRHLMEVATIRWNPVWPNSVGQSRRHHECIWLGRGDAAHSMLDPYLDFYYTTGYYPAKEAATRLANAMTKTTSGEWRYLSNPIAGLARMYTDTQNPIYKEHADRLWNTLCFPDKNTWWVMDHGNRMTMWYAPLNPQCNELLHQWALNPETMDRFQGADLLTKLFIETRDNKYAQAANKLVPSQRDNTITQSVLAGLRAACYAGESVAAANTLPVASAAKNTTAPASASTNVDD